MAQKNIFHWSGLAAFEKSTVKIAMESGDPRDVPAEQESECPGLVIHPVIEPRHGEKRHFTITHRKTGERIFSTKNRKAARAALLELCALSRQCGSSWDVEREKLVESKCLVDGAWEIRKKYTG